MPGTSALIGRRVELIGKFEQKDECLADYVLIVSKYKMKKSLLFMRLMTLGCLLTHTLTVLLSHSSSCA